MYNGPLLILEDNAFFDTLSRYCGRLCAALLQKAAVPQRRVGDDDIRCSNFQQKYVRILVRVQSGESGEGATKIASVSEKNTHRSSAISLRCACKALSASASSSAKRRRSPQAKGYLFGVLNIARTFGTTATEITRECGLCIGFCFYASDWSFQSVASNWFTLVAQSLPEGSSNGEGRKRLRRRKPKPIRSPRIKSRR